MYAKHRLPFLIVLSGLAWLIASGCETPPNGAKPGGLFGPPPAATTNAAKPAGAKAMGAKQPGKTGLPPELDVTTIPTRDDITNVYQFFVQDPWIRNSEGRVVGFSASVYFYSGATARGSFVPGKALAWLYQFDHKPDGQLERKLVQVWELNEQDAMGFRVRRQSQMGYAYGFFFQWPPNVDLSGKTIEIMFGYERLDGKVYTGAARRFQVPFSRYATSPPGPTELPRATPKSPAGRPEAEPVNPSAPPSTPEPQS